VIVVVVSTVGESCHGELETCSQTSKEGRDGKGKGRKGETGSDDKLTCSHIERDHVKLSVVNHCVCVIRFFSIIVLVCVADVYPFIITRFKHEHQKSSYTVKAHVSSYFFGKTLP